MHVRRDWRQRQAELLGRGPVVNPFTGRTDWALLRDNEGGIRGVRATVVLDEKARTQDYAIQP